MNLFFVQKNFLFGRFPPLSNYFSDDNLFLLKSFCLVSCGTMLTFGLASVVNELKRKATVQRMITEMKTSLKSVFENKKIFLVIFAINTAVTLSWQIPECRLFIFDWFMSSPDAVHPYITMISSTFCDIDFITLSKNMFVLSRFIDGISQLMSLPMFLSLYISCGMWNNFACNLLKVVKRKTNYFTCDATGAISAVVAFTCALLPNYQISIPGLNLIIPHSFSVIYEFLFLLTVDSIRLVTNLCSDDPPHMIFGCVGRLSGAVFGLGFSYFFWSFYMKKKKKKNL